MSIRKWFFLMKASLSELDTSFKLLNNWLETGKVTMQNDPLKHTRVDPHTKKGSTLDLGVVSKNIEKCVKSFEVDTDKKWTPFAIRKRKGVAEKHFTDHRTIKMKLQIKSQKGGKGKNEKKRPVIDYQNKEGWLLYPLVADEYAEEMKRAIKKEKDPNDLMRRLKIIDTNIQLDSFGVKWKRRNQENQKERKIQKKSEQCTKKK